MAFKTALDVSELEFDGGAGGFELNFHPLDK